MSQKSTLKTRAQLLGGLGVVGSREGRGIEEEEKRGRWWFLIPVVGDDGKRNVETGGNELKGELIEGGN